MPINVKKVNELWDTHTVTIIAFCLPDTFPPASCHNRPNKLDLCNLGYLLYTPGHIIVPGISK